jgi:serine/threonine-protein kinase HipA
MKARIQMTGSENELYVYSGADIVARLMLQDNRLRLQYSHEWQQSGFAISPHLPLSGDIQADNILRFLRNLFPEGEVLDALLTNLRISKTNTFAIIRALGNDTSGAFLFSPSD